MKTEKATFAAGCFWGIEHAFSEIPGVMETQVGYTGGTKRNPTYEEVCSGNTGHAESVLVTFDPSKVSYRELVKNFFDIHDPTQEDRQGPDIGSQYRSAIFYHSPNQKRVAERTKRELDDSKMFKKPIATEIKPAKKFWPAEGYHQKYYKKHKTYACFSRAVKKIMR